MHVTVKKKSSGRSTNGNNAGETESKKKPTRQHTTRTTGGSSSENVTVKKESDRKPAVKEQTEAPGSLWTGTKSEQGSSEDEMGGKVIENEHEDSSVHYKKNKQATRESATANLSATRREEETDKTVPMESKKTVMTEEQTVETQGKSQPRESSMGLLLWIKRLKVQKLPTV